METLLLPFEKGFIPRPASRALLIRGEAAPAIDASWRELLAAEQTWRPAFEGLQALGVPRPAQPDGPFDMVLVHLGKDRAENLGLIANGWDRLADGGCLVACGAKAEGAQAVEKTLGALHALDGHLPKHGCRVFWLTKSAPSPMFLAALGDWRHTYAPAVRIENTYVSRPGLFSWDRIDPGSALLAAHLPAGMKGDVADFGCGWGYLSGVLAATQPAIRSLTMIDAEQTALDCAEANVRTALGARPADARPLEVRTVWADLTRPPAPDLRFDWVISNPPYHAGHAADPAIGQRFIETAHAALKPRGRVVLVANRHLPYEATLKQRFGAFETLADSKAFKVLMAHR